MFVRDAMSGEVLTVGPAHTLRQAATMMAKRRVGSVVVADPESGLGIMTERDVLYALGNGLDPDVELTSAHITWEVVYAAPQWTLEEAAHAMVRGGFRHLVVLDAEQVLGVISVRDIVRVWSQERSATPTA